MLLVIDVRGGGGWGAYDGSLYVVCDELIGELPLEAL